MQKLKEIIQEKGKIAVKSQSIIFNGNPLSDNQKSLKDYGICENDILLVQIKSTTAVDSGNQDRIETIRQSVLNDAQLQAQMQPEMDDAARNDPQKFRTLMESVLSQQQQQRSAQQQEISALNSDPFDVEAQKKIEEMMRLQNVQTNMEHAMEHNPEAFGSVVMLYIDCEVNDKPVKAFVDSGAQATISKFG